MFDASSQQKSNYTKILNSEMRKSLEEQSVIKYSKANKSSRNLSLMQPFRSEILMRPSNGMLKPNDSK